MKKLLVLLLVMGLTCASYASLYDEAVLRVNFGGDSVDDLNGPISTGSATDVTFVNVTTPMKNSNGRAAYFNGSTSGIAYNLGANNELKIESSLTYHARINVTTTTGEHFVMGRYGTTSGDTKRVSVLTITKSSSDGNGIADDVWGYAEKAGGSGYSNIGHPAVDAITTGHWYDVFFVFSSSHYFRTYVYDAETGSQVAVSNNWGTGIAALYDASDINFWVGMRGDVASKVPFKGYMEQVNVWNKALKTDEMASLSNEVIPEPATIGLITMGALSLFRKR